ncbi:MAG: hypothetical protein ACLP5H_30360, partial [Desulfomonilaceae bacterium]
MMSTDHKDERIKALRQDPDFRALVNALKSQTPDQVDSFYSLHGCSEHEEKGEAQDERSKGEEVEREGS